MTSCSQPNSLLLADKATCFHSHLALQITSTPAGSKAIAFPIQPHVFSDSAIEIEGGGGWRGRLPDLANNNNNNNNDNNTGMSS